MKIALIFCGAIVEPELFAFFQKKGNLTISRYFLGKNSTNVFAFELPNLSKVIKAIGIIVLIYFILIPTLTKSNTHI